jgi:2-keto-4-pentenoate hydratase/2-oxohepta-3-ene-1,7-dioic acid hydratase in catechol pathway
MRLASFEIAGVAGRTRHLGALVDGDADIGTMVDLGAAARCHLARAGATPEAARRIAAALVPANVTAFVEGGTPTLDAAREALAAAIESGWETDPTGAQVRYDTRGVGLLAAVPEPPLLRDFMAFEQHLHNVYPRLGREIPAQWYELPVYYKGNPTAMGAHGDDIPVPSYADALDLEFEIAAVVGTGGVDIAEEDALDHVFGWTVYDDFSARTIQSQEMAVGLGPAKGKDFLRGHVLGPCLVTVDEVPDPYALTMTARVNGETWTNGSTADMHWRFEQMIAHASRGERIRAGEVFGSGTVGGGSGMEQDRKLAVGDVIELEVERLGLLRNRIVAPTTRSAS